VLGYRVDPANRRLVVDEGEAPLLREIFAQYDSGRSLLEIARDLNGRGVRTKLVVGGNGKPYGGREWDKAAIQKTLTNPLYLGLVRYKHETHPGQHEALVERDLWDRVQRRLRERGSTGGMHIRNKHGALLKGLLRCGCCGSAMGHVYATKTGQRVYRYYSCQTVQKRGRDACRCQSLPADQIEAFVVDQIRRIGTDPALRSQTLAELRSREKAALGGVEEELAAVRGDLKRARAEVTSAARRARTDSGAATSLPALHERVAGLEQRASELEAAVEDARARSVTKAEVDAALSEFTGLWSALTTDERAALLRSLVREITFDSDKETIGIAFQPLGLRSLAGGAVEDHEEAA
jgi:site-specific DNA recombinase